MSNMKLILTLLCAFAFAAVPLLAADAPSPLRIVQTKAGTHYAICAEKPAQPAPTLFIIAGPMTSVAADKSRWFIATGDALSKQGWLFVVLDPACEGYALKPGEPSSLAGWATHAKNGTEFVKPYVESCRDVLDHLIAEGFTDPQRVAVEGVSRGGFCALQFAAAEPRIKAVIGVSPVTNPLALKEFAGVTPPQIAVITLDQQLEKLAGRTIWMSIGNTDDRVSTDDCISFARRLVATTRRLKPELKMIPVHLHVTASLGHGAPDGTYLAAAEFLLKQVPLLAKP
jgi:dienelactone hydrolase